MKDYYVAVVTWKICLSHTEMLLFFLRSSQVIYRDEKVFSGLSTKKGDTLFCFHDNRMDLLNTVLE